jgi:PmbA protein
LNDIYSLLSKAKNKGIDAEIIYTNIKSIELSKEKQHLGISIDEEGYGLRILLNQRIGFAYANEISEKLLDSVIEASKVVDPDPANEIPKPEPISYEVSSIYNPELENPFEILKEYLEIVKNVEDKVNITSVKCGGGVGKVKIVNTEGIDVESKFSFLYIGVEANYIKDRVTPEIYEYIETRGPAKKLIVKIIDELVNKVEKMKNARKNEKRIKDVIFTPKAVNELIVPLLSHSISLENFYRGRSIFKENEHLEDNITIIDDPTIPDSPYSRPFDGEGLPTRKVLIIDKGTVKSFLSNTYWANKANKENTHSSSRTYMSLPAISTSNLVFNKETTSDLNDLVVIDQVQGVHTSDFDTGFFSVTASVAWDKEGGLRELVISGNLKDILKNIKAMGNDIRRYGKCLCGSLIVSNLHIA